MKTAQVAAMRESADEFERRAALAPDRATKERLADLAIQWHWEANQAEPTREALRVFRRERMLYLYSQIYGLAGPPPTVHSNADENRIAACSLVIRWSATLSVTGRSE